MSDHPDDTRVRTDAETDAGIMASFEGAELFPHLVRLIARGKPVSVEELAAAAGWPARDVERLAHSQPGTDWDEEGHLVGFGLTLRPTAHRFTVQGRTLYTWCAADTLIFTMILGQRTTAESTCPATGAAVRIELSPDSVISASPGSAVISQRLGTDLMSDLRAQVCDHGLFFASPAAASGWAAEHPDGEVLGVSDAFDRYRTVYEELNWRGE